MDNTDLFKIRDEVEKMEKIHQVNILKIFKKYNITVSISYCDRKL